MRKSEEQVLITRAAALVREHFEHLNNGELAQAKQQLFWPAGMGEKPLGVYLDTMREIAPFQVTSLEIRRFEDVKDKRHGVVATIWIDVTVTCSLGERSSDLTVWWFPAEDRCLISARPTHWVLEKLKMKEME